MDPEQIVRVKLTSESACDNKIIQKLSKLHARLVTDAIFTADIPLYELCCKNRAEYSVLLKVREKIAADEYERAVGAFSCKA